MAFIQNYNPQDDQTEVTGQTTSPEIVSPIVGADIGVVNLTSAPTTATTTTTGSPTPTASTPGSPDTGSFNQTNVGQTTPAVTAAPNPNATRRSGFSNIQRYLQANQAGAQNLGTQVAGNIAQTGDVARQKIGDVAQQAAQAPAADIYNTQADIDAQQAIVNANQRAALTANIAGQSQLIRNIAPTTSRGGVNLNQFLMQNSPGYEQVAAAAQGIAPLSSQYSSQVQGLQEAATTRQAVAKLAEAARLAELNKTNIGNVTITTPGTSQVPNTSTVGANRDTGATTADPYLGLSAEQIAYLQNLQSKYGSPVSGTGNPVAAARTGMVPRADITRTIAPVSVTGGRGGENTFGVYGSTPNDGTVSTGLGGFSVSPEGKVTANTTGLSQAQASALGAFGGALLGMPGLSVLGSLLNSYTNKSATEAAESFARATAPGDSGAIEGGQTATAGVGGTGSAASAAGGAAAAAAAAAGQSAAAQGAAAQAAVNAAIAGATPAEAAAAAQRAAAVQNSIDAENAARAAAEQAARDAAVAAENQRAYAAAVAAENARNAAAAEQAAREQAARDAADREAAAFRSQPGYNAPTGYGANGMGPPSSAMGPGNYGGSTGGYGGSYGSGSVGGFGGGGSSGGGAATGGSGGDASGGGDRGTRGGWKDGGYIQGPGTARSDSIPSMLSDGEYVINARVVQALGREFFDKLNKSVK